MLNTPIRAAMATIAVSTACATSAQQSIFIPSATLPGKDLVTVRETFMLTTFRDDPSPADRDITHVHAMTEIQYGLGNDASLLLAVPLRFVSEKSASGTDTDFNVHDLVVGGRWRFIREDLGPLDTFRTALDVGLELPAGSESESSGSVDPIIRLNSNLILGRHGISTSLMYKLTTDGEEDPTMPGDSTDDLFMAQAGYLYRLSPSEFTVDTTYSTYAVFETMVHYETNGDRELLVAPGFLWEGRRFAWELGLRLPVNQQLSERPASEFTLAAGIRVLF